MSDSSESDDPVLLARLEELGEVHARILQSSAGFPQTSQRAVIKWLAKKDQESTRIREASQAEQLEIARSAKDAAWVAARAAERAARAAEAANRRATIAIIIAAASAIIAIVIPWAFH
jgi:hypothetical protein